MKIEVLVTQWGADGEVFVGGVHEIEKPTKKLLRLVAGAEAAGSVKATASKEERAAIDAAVEAQTDSEAAYEKAQANGSWHEGNYDQFASEVAQGLRDSDQIGQMPDKETYVAERTVSG